eukprot:4284244-Heterocapsa_arctica.AAC.1
MLEQAFQGGPFHKCLTESLPACRAAVVQAAAEIIRERQEREKQVEASKNGASEGENRLPSNKIIDHTLLI